MKLNLPAWNENDGKNFTAYISTLSKGEAACEREKRILNCTRECLAIGAPAVSDLAAEIFKGNYKSFLDLKLFDNTALTAVYAKILCKISDFNEFVHYLTPYLDDADGWYSTDGVKYKGAKKHPQELFDLIEKYAASVKTFYRRMAVIFAFNFAADKSFENRLTALISSLKNEKEYYVNMAVAWLTCELVIKNRDFGMDTICGDTLNDFAKNKAILKCCDSFRISDTDKALLKTNRTA